SMPWRWAVIDKLKQFLYRLSLNHDLSKINQHDKSRIKNVTQYCNSSNLGGLVSQVHQLCAYLSLAESA
ncbi:MAG TPA: hypothetical protein PK164_02270, partial [Nitrosomonas sp.]|nr:hypothetical protein [Nitrosomonas sp.]